jgi:hypothetical protein
MPITTMSEMWRLLDAYTVTPDRQERPINHVNEWGGFSRLLEMPVFAAWHDLVEYNRESKTTTALVLDGSWRSPVGAKNQERWLLHSEQYGASIAAFFIIHAVDVDAEPRKVKSIDDRRLFVGRVTRSGSKTYIVGSPRERRSGAVAT